MKARDAKPCETGDGPVARTARGRPRIHWSVPPSSAQAIDAGGMHAPAHPPHIQVNQSMYTGPAACTHFSKQVDVPASAHARRHRVVLVHPGSSQAVAPQAPLARPRLVTQDLQDSLVATTKAAAHSQALVDAGVRLPSPPPSDPAPRGELGTSFGRPLNCGSTRQAIGTTSAGTLAANRTRSARLRTRITPIVRSSPLGAAFFRDAPARSQPAPPRHLR